MFSYFRHIIKCHLGFLVFALIFLPLIQYLLINVFTGLETKPFIDTVMKIMPPQFRMIIGEQFISSLSIEGAAGFGLNHPVVLAIIIILIISITSRHIAGYIENGNMEMLLSFPLSRTILILRLWFVTAMILLVVVLFTIAGLFAGVYFCDTLTSQFILKIIPAGINLYLLMITIMSFSLMISTFFRESGRASYLSSIVLLVFYFTDILSAVWKSMEFMKPFNIFYYYQPQKLLTAHRSLYQNLPLLVLLTVSFLIVSLWQFKRRDI